MNNLKQFFLAHTFEAITITLILIFASYIRLNHIRDYQVFLGDQGRDVLTVKKMIVDHDVTFLGPTASVGGFFLGPFYYYLMIIPLALSGLDPVGPAIMVAFLSILTTWMLYSFGKKYFSTQTGLIAAAIFAISRLVVEYARSSWNPNVLPFFSFLLVYSSAIILENKSKRPLLWFFIAGSCLGIIPQLHYQAAGMHLFAVAVYLIYLWKKSLQEKLIFSFERLKEFFAALFGVLFFLGPFLAFEIYHGFPNISNIFRFVSGRSGNGFTSGGYTYEFIVRDTFYRLFLRIVGGGNDLIAILAIIITVSGLLYTLYLFISRFYAYGKTKGGTGTFFSDLSEFILKVFRTPYGVGFLVIVLWLIFGVAPWGFYKSSIYDYYYSYMYPLPVILLASSLGLFISLNSRRLRKSVRYNNLKATAALVVWCFVGIIIYYNYKSVLEIFPGMQVQRAQWVAQAILKHKAPGTYNFALITPGNSDHAYRYFLEIWGERPLPLEEQVTSQLMVFCEPDVRPCEPEGNSLWEVAGFGPASIVGQWETIGLPLYRLEHIEESKNLEGKPAKKG